MEIVGRDIILSYHKFGEEFITNTDVNTRKMQIGGVISQNDKPIAFYLRKSTTTKIKYSTT